SCGSRLQSGRACGRRGAIRAAVEAPSLYHLRARRSRTSPAIRHRGSLELLARKSARSLRKALREKQAELDLVEPSRTAPAQGLPFRPDRGESPGCRLVLEGLHRRVDGQNERTPSRQIAAGNARRLPPRGMPVPPYAPR